MSSKTALRVLVACLAIAIVVSATTIPLKRRPHRFEPKDDAAVALKKTSQPSWRDLRRTLPMNGGILTLGAYFLTVTVGSGAGQVSFDAIVDTGSSNTAVPSVGCTTCQSSAFYSAAVSPSAVPLSCGDPQCQNCVPTAVGSTAIPAASNATRCPYGTSSCSAGGLCAFSISYGGSSSAIAGTTVWDQVCLGPMSESAPCAFSPVNQIESEFPTGTMSDGIVGFAFPANACNPTCQPTILDALVAGGALQPEENIFGLCLTPATGGAMDLGAPNASRHFGPLLYTPIVSQQWFNIAVRDIEIGGVSIGVPSFFYQIRNDALGSFVDSGTGVVLVSPYVYSVIQGVLTTRYATLSGVTDLFGETSTCVSFSNATTAIDAYPTIAFVIAGEPGSPDFRVTMSGKDYVMPTSLPVEANTTYCSGIQGVPSIGVILGDIIMQNYYIVFDRFNSRLGFAPLRSCA